MLIDELQTYADALVIRYTALFNLQEWNIKIVVQDEPTYLKKHGKNFGNATNGCADIFQNKKKAKIYIKETEDMSTFTNCVLHELTHIPLNDMYVHGLVAFQDMTNEEIKFQTILNWEWILEAAVCRIAHALERLEESIEDQKC